MRKERNRSLRMQHNRHNLNHCYRLTHKHDVDRRSILRYLLHFTKKWYIQRATRLLDWPEKGL
jgi:hypothetical protein